MSIFFNDKKNKEHYHDEYELYNKDDFDGADYSDMISEYVEDNFFEYDCSGNSYSHKCICNKLQDITNKVFELRSHNRFNDAISLMVSFLELDSSIENVVRLLPELSACYRLVNSPKMSYNFSQKYYEIYGTNIFTKELTTSLSAACEDFGDHDKAVTLWEIARSLDCGDTEHISNLALRLFGKVDPDN